MKTRNGTFASILKASTMSSALRLTGLPAAGGGVAGWKKHTTPSTSEEIAASVKMCVLLDQPRPPTMRPATIQPMVPHTRRAGNLLRSSMFVKATVLLKPSVGI